MSGHNLQFRMADCKKCCVLFDLGQTCNDRSPTWFCDQAAQGNWVEHVEGHFAKRLAEDQESSVVCLAFITAEVLPRLVAAIFNQQEKRRGYDQPTNRQE